MLWLTLPYSFQGVAQLACSGEQFPLPAVGVWGWRGLGQNFRDMGTIIADLAVSWIFVMVALLIESRRELRAHSRCPAGLHTVAGQPCWPGFLIFRNSRDSKSGGCV